MKAKFFYITAILALCVVGFACSGDWKYDTEGNLSNVLARPQNLKCDIANEPEYVFSWGRVKGANKYAFELYRENVLVETQELSDPTSVSEAGLSLSFTLSEVGMAHYVAKVKAVSGDKQSSYSELAVATPDYVEFGPSSRFKDTVQWAINNSKSILLLPGSYAGHGGTVYLQDNAFVMKAKDPSNRPTNVALTFNYYAKESDKRGAINIKDIEFDGSQSGGGSNLATFLEFPAGSSTGTTPIYTSVGEFVVGDVLIKNCVIKSYQTSFLKSTGAGALDGASIESITVDNCLVGPFASGGNDFIDFRTIYIKAISIKNSTLNNVGTSRAFARVDEPCKGTFSLDHCTLNSVSNGGTAAASSLFYLRSKAARTVSNCLITNSTNNGVPSDGITYSYNAYWGMTANAMSRDNAKTELSADPFAGNPAGDFTLSADSPLRTGGASGTCVGDPRWAQ